MIRLAPTIKTVPYGVVDGRTVHAANVALISSQLQAFCLPSPHTGKIGDTFWYGVSQPLARTFAIVALQVFQQAPAGTQVGQQIRVDTGTNRMVCPTRGGTMGATDRGDADPVAKRPIFRCTKQKQ